MRVIAELDITPEYPFFEQAFQQAQLRNPRAFSCRERQSYVLHNRDRAELPFRDWEIKRTSSFSRLLLHCIVTGLTICQSCYCGFTV